MTSAADVSAPTANVQLTTGRNRDGHFAKARLPLIYDYSSEQSDGPITLVMDVRTSRFWRGLHTMGCFYALRPDGTCHTDTQLDRLGPKSFSRVHEVACLSEKALAKLHAETLASAEFRAWLAQSLEYFRAGGKL